jgi:hypothetical protein
MTGHVIYSTGWMKTYNPIYDVSVIYIKYVRATSSSVSTQYHTTSGMHTLWSGIHGLYPIWALVELQRVLSVMTDSSRENGHV